MGPHILEEDKLKHWKTKRLSTFVIFCIFYFTNGMIYGLIANTCWIYIQSHFKPERPVLVYSVMMNARYLATFLFTVIVSNFHDKHRKTKMILILISWCGTGSGLLYIINYSYYFPILGIFLSGVTLLILPVTVGEIARCYHPNELAQKIPLMSFGTYVGSMPAALILYVSKNTIFKVGPFIIDDSNIVGLVSGIAYPIIQVLTICFVHDLSLEYDLKETLLVYENDAEDEPEKMKLLHTCDDVSMTRASSNREEDSSLASTEQIRNNGTILEKLVRLWTNFDVALIYCLIFLFHYCGILCFSYLPLFVEKDLKFNAQTFSFLYLLYSVMITIFLPLVAIVKFSSKAAYYVGFISFFLLIQVGVCILVIGQNHSPVHNFVVLSVIMVLLSCFYTGEDIFLTCTIAKLVKPDIQSFADGIRVFLGMLGRFLSSLSVPLFIEQREIFLSVLLSLILLALFVLLLRRKTLIKSEAVV